MSPSTLRAYAASEGPRSLLLSLGIPLQALLAIVTAFFYGLGALLVGGFLGLSAADFFLLSVWPFQLIAALGAAAFLVGCALQLVVAYVCLRAWQGARGWLWALVAASLVNLISAGPFSIVAGVLSIVGALQELDTCPGRSSGEPVG